MSLFSTKVRYALRLVIEVSRTPDPSLPISLEEISRRTGISRRYLDLLAVPLRSAGLVRSRRGPRGGYELGKPREEITLYDVVEAAMGPPAVSDCVAQPGLCDRSGYCECRLVFELATAQLKATLSGITLADMSDVRSLVRVRDDLFGLLEESGDQPASHREVVPLRPKSA